MYFDPMYFVIVAPGLLLALWASFKVKSTFKRFSTISVSSGMTGAEVAAELLRRSGVRGVRVEISEGWLSDHYDPAKHVVRLSPDVYNGRSISAVGVAAHECGHAIQHAEGYKAMTVRQTLAMPASYGSSLAIFVIIGGAMLQMSGLIWLGILLFSLVVLFQLVTLPVELNASSRARQRLLDVGLVSASEDGQVAKVLNAAALTYVAALISSILTLLYYVLRFTGSFRSDD